MPDHKRDTAAAPAVCSSVTSRLRRGGLCAATAALAVAAAAPMTAQASIVYNGTLNKSMEAGVNTSVTIAPGRQLSVNGHAFKSNANFAFDYTGMEGVIQAAELAEGHVIGSDDDFGFSGITPTRFDPASCYQGVCGAWAAPTKGYFGFRMVVSGNTLYGWGELDIRSYSSGGMTFTRYAYEDSGASILAGDTGQVTAAVSEPASLLLAATAVGMVCGLHRRRHRLARPASLG